MYRYKVKLYPELLKMRESLNLKDSEDVVFRAAREFNRISEKAANMKYIEEDSVVVSKDSIHLVLASDAWLKFPTKALRTMIMSLAKIEPFKGLIASNGRLFRGEYAYLESDSELVEEKELTDEEAMIELVKLFHRQNDTQLIREIKQLLKERS